MNMVPQKPGGTRPVSPGSIPVIAIAGGTGSGKTTIAAAIETSAGASRVTRISHDSYYRDRFDLSPAERAGLNFDHPESLETELLVEHLDQLSAGNAVDIPVYDFVEHRRTSEPVRTHPRDIILVEGVLVLAEPALRERCALCIYVDTDDDVRFIRRLHRDVHERGRSMQSVIDQYLATVRPMHIQFVRPSRQYADIIVPEGGHNSRAIEMICSQIGFLINKRQHQKESNT
jgi:uridine kinase